MNKLTVVEDNFELQVSQWDEFTVELLKSYADWKYKELNGIEIDVKDDVNIINIESDFKKDVSNLIKPLVDNRNKDKKQVKKKEYFSTLFSDKDILSKYNEAGTITLYKPIFDFILENIPSKFKKNDLSDAVFEFYKTKKWKITKATAQNYSYRYLNYMLKNSFVVETEDKCFKILRKTDEKEVVGKTETSYQRAPNNTSLFLNWMKDKKFFKIADFCIEHPSIEKEKAKEIVLYQVDKGNVTQVSDLTFRVDNIV